MKTRKKEWLAAAIAGLTLAGQVRTASACGCFAPPSPATPVVQAGERILFAQDGGNITAHIQIQYQGAAADFGWLVPLPSVPTLELGTDELFKTLGARTNPQYSLTTTRDFCGGGSTSMTGGGGCTPFGGAAEDTIASADAGALASLDLGSINDTEVVAKASIGPYDYAVLKADDKTEMLSWLAANNYFVPDATGEAVAPYIHAGGFFLALKLRAGENSGDIVPIVLHYASDLPMIPITLTQVGATENMGVLVWMLGESRAIPRNYSHVVLDELPIWENTFDYPAQAIRAVREAPNHHAFLTEYAGSSLVMSNQLDYPGRFGNLDDLRQLTSPADYLAFLAHNGYTYDGTLYSILERYLPEPAELVSSGISESTFYQYYFDYATTQIDADAGIVPFDAGALTDEINTRIVLPARAAQKLFDAHPYLTRLYTALSPVDMNLDPVFSQNPDLPTVPSQHGATLTFPCVGDAWLQTDAGLEEQWVSGLPPNLPLPASLRIERLRESGQPEVVTDNAAAIATIVGKVDHGSATGPTQTSDSSSSGCACDIHHGMPTGQLGTLLLVGGAILFVRRRRRA